MNLASKTKVGGLEIEIFQPEMRATHALMLHERMVHKNRQDKQDKIGVDYDVLSYSRSGSGARGPGSGKIE